MESLPVRWRSCSWVLGTSQSFPWSQHWLQSSVHHGTVPAYNKDILENMNIIILSLFLVSSLNNTLKYRLFTWWICWILTEFVNINWCINWLCWFKFGDILSLYAVDMYSCSCSYGDKLLHPCVKSSSLINYHSCRDLNLDFIILKSI